MDCSPITPPQLPRTPQLTPQPRAQRENLFIFDRPWAAPEPRAQRENFFQSHELSKTNKKLHKKLQKTTENYTKTTV